MESVKITAIGRPIDHIVYAVPDLSAAMDRFEEKTGLRPQVGGQHTNQGTKNALVNLGDGCYLEILAVDQENLAVSAPRWMGIDLIQEPMITRWSLNSKNLTTDSEILGQYNEEMGGIEGGSRKMSDGQLLTWEMIMPLAAPAVDIIPFMTDWQNSDRHPTDRLSSQCQLISLTFTHPNPEQLRGTLKNLNLDLHIDQGNLTSISAKIQTPKGIVQL